MSTVLPPELSPRGSVDSASAGRGNRALGVFTTLLAAAVFVVSGGGWVLATYYDGKIGRIPGLGGLLSGSNDGPMTILVVGSDSREGLSSKQAHHLGTGTAANAGGQRSDTMMLVHLSADRKDVTVVSLPRDSYLTIPSYTDSAGNKHPAQKNKLNAAFSLGGAPLLIRTVTQATGMQ
ncbi:MAG TPA: LCP family protein, partial [Actinomycetes bacterium]|nr:LCP family protein [Actinomycetes bacterium]